jgi:adenylate cyclase
MRFCGHCGAAAAATTAPPGPSAPPPPAPQPAPTADTTSETLRSFVATQVADRLVEAGGELPEERRLITALFADVSGFTTLADRLDPEQLLEVIDPVISAMSSVVGRYEGYVEKFAGDALLALFGAPVAHEDDAQRALLVALEMHRELARVCSELGPEASGLTLHVGVNSGHGIARILGSEARTDYAVLGDSVILAQRLESAAPPGETFVSDLTYRMARDDFEFESVGELTLKGKLEPVFAWKLLGRKQAAASVESRRELVGRESELAAVEQALRELTIGRGAVVTVTGEPGVGKSRLTAEVKARAAGTGRRWLETRCLSYGAALAYWPYSELVRGFAGVSQDDDRDTAAEAVANALGADRGDELPFFARLLDVGSPGDDVASLEPEAFRRGLHDAFAAWLRSLAEEQPLVLAIEDVHWADSSSLALTEELASLCREAPIALYLVARPEGEATVEPLRASAGDATTLDLALGPLDETGVGSLVASMLGGVPPPLLVPAVAERTAGNPFFVEETVRSLQDRGDLVQEDGRWQTVRAWSTEELPPTLEGLLASRIDILPRGAASLLQTASVVGRRMRVQLLRTVAGDRAPFEPALERVVEGGFLDRYDDDGSAGVTFHHALVQDVAYSRLLRRQRRDLHRRVAEVAEALYGAGDDVVDLLARHLYLGEGDKAVEFLRRAGVRAKRLFANDEAILHFSRALELAPDDREIRLELADLHELVGSYGDALRLYGDVRDASGDIRAWRGLASTLRTRGEYAEALSVVDDAFRDERLRDADVTPLWVEQAWTLSATGRFSQAIDVLEAGLTAVGTRRDGVVGQMLLHLARAETLEGKFDDALHHGAAALQIFEEQNDLRGLATAHRIISDPERRLRRLDEAAASLERALELAERVGNAEELGACLINLGVVQHERGAIDDAIDCDRRAIEQFERIGHLSGRAQGYANLAHKLSEAGRLAEAFEYSERALEMARAIGNELAVADITDTMAAIRLGEGDALGAIERAEEAVRLYLSLNAKVQAASTLEIEAKAWEVAGEAERARTARDRARELTTSVG